MTQHAFEAAFERAELSHAFTCHDVILDAMDAIKRRGDRGTIHEALADIDEAYARLDALAAEHAKQREEA